METVIGVVSGKGGVGKTVLVSNLGLALNSLGLETFVLDADLATANLGIHLGMYQFPMGVQEALYGNIKPSQAIYRHPTGLKVLPASVSLYYLDMNPGLYSLRDVVEDCTGTVLVDSPPGLGREASLALRACDESLIVTTPQNPAVTDALKAVALSRELGVEPRGAVLNMTRGSHELTKQHVESLLELPVIAALPYDKEVERSIFERIPVLLRRPVSPFSVAVMKLASEISGLAYKPPRLLKLRRIVRRG